MTNYDKAGSSDFDRPDRACLTRCGKYAKLPICQSHRLCEYEIRQQCCICPKNSTNTDDLKTFGNRCIIKWGHAPAIRGNGAKVKCGCCGSTVNQSGPKGHQQTDKCRKNRDTSSTVSTSVGSNDFKQNHINLS